MAIATLAAVNQFVFAYLHIRLKLPQTSRLQRSFQGAPPDERPALVDHSATRKANWMASSVESVYPEWRAHAASVEEWPAPSE